MSSTVEALTAYNAKCHCRAVTFTVRVLSLPDHEVTSCNCSICSRNGYLMIEPDRKGVEFHTGYDHMVSYFFGDRKGAHRFCPTCGSSILVDFDGDSKLYVNVRLVRPCSALKLLK